MSQESENAHRSLNDAIGEKIREAFDEGWTQGWNHREEHNRTLEKAAQECLSGWDRAAHRERAMMWTWLLMLADGFFAGIMAFRALNSTGMIVAEMIAISVLAACIVKMAFDLGKALRSAKQSSSDTDAPERSKQKNAV